MGIIYAGLSIVDLVEHLAKPSVYGVMMRLVMIIAPVLIVWYAYKWPK